MDTGHEYRIEMEATDAELAQKIDNIFRRIFFLRVTKTGGEAAAEVRRRHAKP